MLHPINSVVLDTSPYYDTTSIIAKSLLHEIRALLVDGSTTPEVAGRDLVIHTPEMSTQISATKPAEEKYLCFFFLFRLTPNEFYDFENCVLSY